VLAQERLTMQKFKPEINRAVSRSAIRYLGGKWVLAPWIISHMPEHTTYVEPFGGGGSVLLRKHPSRLEVYNDLDAEIYGFFRVLQDPEQCRQLLRLLRRTPFSRQQFQDAFKPTDDPIIRAQRAVVRAYMCIHHSALFDMGKAGGFASSDWSGIRSWRTYPRALVAVHRRLQKVVLASSIPTTRPTRCSSSTRPICRRHVTAARATATT
jgi:DNA adenine methylase